MESNWLVTVGLVTSSVITVIANLFLLFIFCRRRGLRTVPNRFVINLLITNLLSSLLLTPLLVIDQQIPTSSANLSIVTNTTTTTTTIEELEIIEENDGSLIKINNSSNFNGIKEIISENILKESSSILAPSIIINNNNNVNVYLCKFAEISTSFVCTLSILSILLICINQYFGVIHSLRYHFYINKYRSTLLIIIIWLIAFIFSILTTFTKNDANLWNLCEKEQTKFNNILIIFNIIYAFIYFIFIILIPIISICLIYICIYRAAHKNSERMRKSTSTNLETSYLPVRQVSQPKTSNLNDDEFDDDGLTLVIDVQRPRTTGNLPKVQSAPNFLLTTSTTNTDDNNLVGSSKENNLRNSNCSSNRNNNNFIISLKYKLSNASMFRYREETRAAKISIIVIFMIIICYLPYGINLILNSKLLNLNYFNYLSLILLIISNMISGFLFAYRNRRVKREIAKLFNLTNKTNSNNNRLITTNILPTNNNNSNSNNNESVAFKRNHSCDNILNNHSDNDDDFDNHNNYLNVPKVIVEIENERKSILKRVCNTSNWTNYKKCNFINVPDSCISGSGSNGEARGSFSSASTQISNED